MPGTASELSAWAGKASERLLDWFLLCWPPARYTRFAMDMEMQKMGASGPAPTRPEHGTWEGHVLPGSFFFIWALWTQWGASRLYLQQTSKRPYHARAWHEFPRPGSTYPVEPILKVLLPFIGIVAELWAGHVSYRRMYNPETGHFELGNLQDWQHAAMYAAFMCSGMADLVGFYAPAGTLLPGVELGFLGQAFLIEGILFAFHLKGTMLDVKLHLLLVLLIFTISALCFAEIRWPQYFMISLMRSATTLVQALWFYQIAQILFTGNPAWDPTTHAAAMMVPFFFVMWMMIVSMTTLAVYAGVSIRRHQRQAYNPLGREGEPWDSPNGHGPSKPEIEIASHHS